MSAQPVETGDHTRTASTTDAENLPPSHALRRFLKLETERLRMRQGLGLGGSEVAAVRSDLVDHVVRRVCGETAEAAGRDAQRELSACSVVALGGYGRRELSPCSDVDLLFLHGGSPTKPLKDFVERVLITLWDAGLSVGHSFRSANECVSEARADLHSRTALSEARLVVGSDGLFQALERRLESALRGSRAARDAFRAQMLREWSERMERFAEAVCVLEPQVKEGPGGLRDLHAVLWVAHVRYGIRGFAALSASGLIEAGDVKAVRAAYDFLLRVRNEAHFTTGRKADLLTLDLHGELAPRLGYRARGGLLATELLMRDYYRRASRLHEVCRSFVESELEPRPRRRLLAALRLHRPGREEARPGALQLRAGASLRSGHAVLEVFERAQAGVPLSRELKTALRQKAALVGGSVRRSREAGETLLRLASHRGRVAQAFRALHETSVLQRLVPEWARITFLVQHDFFHKYTVDEHTLRAVDALDELAGGRDPQEARLARLLDEIADVRPLYLGMLLHDIAKGRGGGHVAKGVVVARRALARLGIGGELAETVVFLVGAHLDMSQTSQHRDLNEPALITAFARRVGTLERLNLLMLLTYADHRAVGPGIWNEWKASLLWELYSLTRHQLEAHGDARPGPEALARERAAAALRAEFPGDEVERHLALLPERYLRATSPERTVSHFRLLRARGEREAAFGWTDLGEGHGCELTVTALDRTGLFARVAGTLSVQGIDILSADLFAREDGVVLDTLRVAEVPGQRPLRPERKARVEAALVEAVAGRVDVAEAFERWRAVSARRARKPGGRAARGPSVRFDQEASALATVVEVKAQDQPGLAYTLAHALAELGLDISFARIATAKALALDVFYVRDAQGRKLTPDSLAGVEQALLDALGAGDKGRSDR
jgi:[protein-PII] uridylyltransferase